MKSGRLPLHGKHKYRLRVVEECEDGGRRRRNSGTSRLAPWPVPAALWANALLATLLLA